ncbi:MAG: hypothetical protein QOJ85_3145, partial [Solirubrobacteraceae bacterium]|nr:hypothetical protein [Solirubrobacteraceae bacterium]
MRVFGELPLCRSQQESDTWIMYEALLNPAFAHHPMTIVCGLDAREQPDSVIEGSWQTHPRAMNEGWSDNDHYHRPDDIVRARTPVPEDVSGLTAVPADLEARALRARLAAEMATADVPALTPLAADGGLRDVRARLLAEMSAAEVPDAGAQNMLIAAGEVLA